MLTDDKQELESWRDDWDDDNDTKVGEMLSLLRYRVGGLKLEEKCERGRLSKT
jgi:hypothetical protein